jgi:hypothetical protein
LYASWEIPMSRSVKKHVEGDFDVFLLLHSAFGRSGVQDCPYL